MRIEDKLIRIRDLTEADLTIMLKWLTDDRVLEYYEGRDVRFTMDTLAEHFLEEIPDGFRVIIEYEDQPVGYGQAYQLSGEMFEEYTIRIAVKLYLLWTQATGSSPSQNQRV